jgi:large subunit ribosomal protein L15
MKLNQLSDQPQARRDRKRIGRGIGSGTGKTSGRGHKGQKSRSGVSIKGFEGGQMPLHRRLPKRGFKNIFRRDFVAVNLGRLQVAIDAGRLDPKKPVDAAALEAAGVVNKPRDGVRLLAKGELKTKVDITVAGASKAAAAAVEKAGGSLTVLAAAPTPGAAAGKKSAAPAATEGPEA